MKFKNQFLAPDKRRTIYKNSVYIYPGSFYIINVHHRKTQTCQQHLGAENTRYKAGSMAA